jgi:hypothetical protein
MWEPRRLTNLWAFTACYRVSFILSIYVMEQTDLNLVLFTTANDLPSFTTSNNSLDARRGVVFVFQALYKNWLTSVLRLLTSSHKLQVFIPLSRFQYEHQQKLLLRPLTKSRTYSQQMQHFETADIRYGLRWIVWLALLELSRTNYLINKTIILDGI